MITSFIELRSNAKNPSLQIFQSSHFNLYTKNKIKRDKVKISSSKMLSPAILSSNGVNRITRFPKLLGNARDLWVEGLKVSAFFDHLCAHI
jgi:hypothetical protein